MTAIRAITITVTIKVDVLGGFNFFQSGPNFCYRMIYRCGRSFVYASSAACVDGVMCV